MAATKGSKSEVIRQIIAENPNAKVADVKAELAKRKVKASVALVSKLVYTSRPGRKKRGGRKASNGHTNMDGLFAAKLLVDKTGGIAPAQAALAQLAKLLA